MEAAEEARGQQLGVQAIADLRGGDPKEWATMVMAAKKGPGPGGGVGGGKAEAEAASEVWCRRVRELGGCSQAGNRHCFECAQRGVTYVDITVGSFVCTTCSGLL